MHWRLKDDPALRDAQIDARALALEAEGLSARFPNAAVNADERRKLRAALYRPLLTLDPKQRSRVVDVILTLMLADAEDRD